jgi:hypothetical protein
MSTFLKNFYLEKRVFLSESAWGVKLQAAQKKRLRKAVTPCFEKY